MLSGEITPHASSGPSLCSLSFPPCPPPAATQELPAERERSHASGEEAGTQARADAQGQDISLELMRNGLLAEELGFLGAASLLALYALIILFCIISALQQRDRFSSLLTLGLASNFFLYFAVNMSMVMGLAPVVGVPLPMVSYGGSAMLVLMVGFGLVQSAHIHRPRGRN